MEFNSRKIAERFPIQFGGWSFITKTQSVLLEEWGVDEYNKEFVKFFSDKDKLTMEANTGKKIVAVPVLDRISVMAVTVTQATTTTK